ncbi:hypothetical protein D5R55_33540 [Burkholderia cenocepacia]|uniref:Uncharacterized protein n=1 Tax=Burkholderia cenocepacia TaxID=95486 RepID=A0A3Q9F9S1_9BURK|nr:hypothetical protein D5R55_33540 [Burkholderia cenocepacia]
MEMSNRLRSPRATRGTPAPRSHKGVEFGADDVTKLFRQFDSVAPRRDAELIRRDIPGPRGTRRGAPRPAPAARDACAARDIRPPTAGNLERPLHFGPSLGEALISGGWRATSNRL